MTYTGHAQYTTAVMANSDFYDDLSDADKKLIQDATDVALDYILDEAVKMDEIGLTKIKETNPGYTINRLTEAERAGPRGKAILEQMKKDLEAAKAKAM